MSKNGTARRMGPPELRGKALAILVRELGYADAVRFMLLHERGKGDYTRDRRMSLPELTVAELARKADAIVRRQGRSGSAPKRRKSA